MPGFPYEEKLEPIVKIGETVKIFDKYYVVKHVEPVQAEIVDLLDAEHANITTGLAPAGTAGDRSKVFSLEKDFALEDGWFGQWRIDLVDDVILKLMHPEASKVLWASKARGTYLMLERPRRSVSVYQPGAASTDVLVWVTTNFTEPPSGKWTAYIKKLAITEESGAAGAVVRFGDNYAAGGDRASAANAKMSFPVGAGEGVVLDEDEIPEYGFELGVVMQTTGGTVRVTATIEERGLKVPFAGSSNREIFTFEDDKYPYAVVINRAAAPLFKARISKAGFKFKVEQLRARPEKWIEIPVGAYG